MKKTKTHFRFKKFTVYHDQCAMKVGTDSVVLGAWVNVNNSRRTLDVGTGCGILALMLAQRNPDAVIDAVEVDDQCASQAMQNVERSPWRDRITIHHTAIQQYRPTGQYDLAISNPPFFNDSLEPPDARRLLSRHTIKLSYDELIKAFDRLLSPTGKFNVILPNAEESKFTAGATENNFHCTRKFAFRTRKEKPVARWLLEFSRNHESLKEDELVLYDKGQHWSRDYERLTSEFYLKL
jgi:tRNA1Val (adenine37-N6)-methyltransferase